MKASHPQNENELDPDAELERLIAEQAKDLASWNADSPSLRKHDGTLKPDPNYGKGRRYESRGQKAANLSGRVLGDPRPREAGRGDQDPETMTAEDGSFDSGMIITDDKTDLPTNAWERDLDWICERLDDPTGRASRVWKDVADEAVDGYLAALGLRLTVIEHRGNRYTVLLHVEQTDERAVLHWMRKYLLHPELTEKASEDLVVGILRAWFDAETKRMVRGRHQNGEPQRQLAAEYGMSQAAISRLCSPPPVKEPGGFPMSPTMAGAILSELEKHTEMLREIKQDTAMRNSLRDLELFAAGAAAQADTLEMSAEDSYLQ